MPQETKKMRERLVHENKHKAIVHVKAKRNTWR